MLIYYEKELDAVLDASQVSVSFIQALQQLEPFGEGNPQPIFGLRYQYDDVRFIGAEAQHVKYIIHSPNLTVLEWGGAERERERQKQHKARRKAIGTLELNEYRGIVSPQFCIKN